MRLKVLVLLFAVCLLSSCSQKADVSEPEGFVPADVDIVAADNLDERSPVLGSTGSGSLNEYRIEIKTASVDTDYDGNSVISVIFAWTNNSSMRKRASGALFMRAYQSGVLLDRVSCSRISSIATDNTSVVVSPGETIDVIASFKLNSPDKPVDFGVEELYGRDDLVISKTFDLAGV